MNSKIVVFPTIVAFGHYIQRIWMYMLNAVIVWFSAPATHLHYHMWFHIDISEEWKFPLNFFQSFWESFCGDGFRSCQHQKIHFSIYALCSVNKYIYDVCIEKLKYHITYFYCVCVNIKKRIIFKVFQFHKIFLFCR